MPLMSVDPPHPYRRRQILRGMLAALAMPALAPIVGGVACADSETMALTPLVIDTGGGPVAFQVEFAATPQERHRGLQQRTALANDRGMLFDFGQSTMQQMWMKDTPIPLDMLFIDDGGRIIGIIARTEPYSLTPLGVGRPARAVLEINGGLAAQLGIRPGDRVHHRMFP